MQQALASASQVEAAAVVAHDVDVEACSASPVVPRRTSPDSEENLPSGSKLVVGAPSEDETASGDEAQTTTTMSDMGVEDSNTASSGSALQARGGRQTSEITTLGLSASLFACITLCQLVGAMRAHSRALLVDCISMGVDAGTMIGNVAVESLKGTRMHKPAELFVGGTSLAMLSYFTVAELRESFALVREPGPAVMDEDQVDPKILMAFGIAGLLLDVVSLCAFRRSHKKTGSGREMNMWTAIMHVGADFLRSSTTLVLSLVITFGDSDSRKLDAWASLIVGATILAGAAAGAIGWARGLVKYALELRSAAHSIAGAQAESSSAV